MGGRGFLGANLQYVAFDIELVVNAVYVAYVVDVVNMVNVININAFTITSMLIKLYKSMKVIADQPTDV